MFLGSKCLGNILADPHSIPALVIQANNGLVVSAHARRSGQCWRFIITPNFGAALLGRHANNRLVITAPQGPGPLHLY